ncbi:MAG: hypothetical protein AAGI68_07890 [Planctomycetota bacterium]
MRRIIACRRLASCVLAFTVLGVAPLAGAETTPVAFVDAPLDAPIDGITFSIRVGENYDERNIRLKVLVTARDESRRGIPREYAVQATLAAQTSHQWVSSLAANRDQHNIMPKYLGHLDFYGLPRGGSVPYRVEVRTSDGYRLMKEGRITISHRHRHFETHHRRLEQAKESVAKAKARLAEAERGSYDHYRAQHRYERAKLELASKAAGYGFADISMKTSAVAEYIGYFNKRAGALRPTDYTSGIPWADKLERDLSADMKSIAGNLFTLPPEDALPMLRSIRGQYQALRGTGQTAGFLRSLAGVVYEGTGSAARARSFLELSYTMSKQAAQRDGNDIKALARHLLPRDFGPVTLSRNEVQAKLCAAADDAAQQRRILARVTDREISQLTQKKLDHAEAEVARLRRQLTTIPGPGSGNARYTTYQRVRQTIASSFDVTDAAQRQARQAALSDFGDLVFVESDHSVHGDLKQALAWAIRDTGVTSVDSRVSLGRFIGASGDANEQMLKGLQLIDDLGEAGGAAEALREMTHANARLKTLLQEVRALPMNSPSQVQAARDAMAEVGRLLTTGGLSNSNLLRVQRALRVLPAEHAQRFAELHTSLDTLKRAHRGADWGVILDRVDGRFGYMTKLVAKGDGARLWASVQEAINTNSASAELGPFDRLLLGAAAMQAIGQYQEQVDAGKDWREAGYRAYMQFSVDVAFTLIPIAGLADLVAEVVSVGVIYAATGERGKYNLSDLTKDIVAVAIDLSAAASGRAGELVAFYWDQGGRPSALRQIPIEDIHAYLARVECRLSAIPMEVWDGRGTPEQLEQAQRLMGQRRVFRVLIRAHEAAGPEAWQTVTLRDQGYALHHPPRWEVTRADPFNPDYHTTLVSPRGGDPIQDEVFVRVITIPQDALQRQGRQARLIDPAAWFERESGGGPPPGGAILEAAHRGEIRGRPANLCVFTMRSPKSRQQIWLTVAEVVHRDSVVQIQAVCRVDQLEDHRRTLMDILQRIRFDR